MGSIKPLPEAVRSTIRSSAVLYDLTRVVEELLFNSLDAAASKVSVFLSLGSSYVKVVDDGSGISRDGLVLLGERYVTSKLCHLADLDAATMTFGFRGEALASISGIALVEISTKAYGKPNGYRKVIKGSKCLYLGIDDDRKDVGTTVVVHDLFYNQPVRKKHMLSSPKKVLDSVKKCVFRTALVHPMVYFTVIDMESEDELLSTHPSSSPLSLLMSGFGIEDSASLHNLKATHGSLKLSGYIYGLYDTFSVKAFQYVYINSRFVCKGPIHKLLNNLVSDFESLDRQNANNWTKKGKRSRSQLFLSYIVNISCPVSSYDLTFESLKTFVEFKDWEPIQTLIKKAIQHLRRKNICCADGLVQAETLKNDVTEDFLDEGPSIRKCRNQKYQPSSLEKLTVDHVFLMDHEDILLEECHGNNGQFEDQQNDLKFVHWTDYSFQSRYDSLAKGTSLVNQKSACQLLTSDNYLEEDYVLENGFTASERLNCHVTDSSISSKFGIASHMAESGVTSRTVTGVFPFASHELCNDSQFRKNNNKPFLQSCSSQRNLLKERDIFERKKRIESPVDSLKLKDKQVWANKRFNMLGVDFRDVSFYDLSTTMWRDGGSCAQISAQLMTKGEIPRDMDVLTRVSMDSLLSFGNAPIEGNGLPSDSIALEENSGFDYQSLSSEWCSVTSNLLEKFNYKNAIEGSFRFKGRTNFGHSSDSEDKDNLFGFDSISRSSNQENFFYNYPDTRLEIDCVEPSGDFCRSPREYNLNHKFSPEHFNVEFEMGDLCSDPNINERKRQRDQCQYEDFEQNSICKDRSRRSQSAPPFYKHKRRFISLHHHLQTLSGEATSNEFNGPFTSAGTIEKPPKKSKGTLDLSFEPNLRKNRSNINNKSDMVFGTITQKGEEIDIDLPHFQEGPETLNGMRVFNLEENQDPTSSLTKWRNGFAQNTVGNSNSCDADNEDNIIDIASGNLYLATESLVPKSIDKKCLRDAKVLQQVDKKFIPIVAGGTLAIIDQHAADERIRLEELRQKVLSGEGKAITYLDTEHELILPEIEYQLLQNYSEQLRNWGWLCDIHTQGSRSFEKNLNLFRRKSSVVILLAVKLHYNSICFMEVPCILGVNLSDADLLDFLQQLADTDGSSTIPPSVIRILNSKACRGAIMFGDPLLPSECSLIVEELKQTSLCFQCAHGRPTTVPVVNLEALHTQIDKMQFMEDGPTEWWHGLCRHIISLERASLRLNAAGT